MVRHPISRAALRARIRSHEPGWLTRARARTLWLRAQGQWQKERGAGPVVPDWGQIKPVYRKLQGDKCAYCERPLPASDNHSREHDLEHFRPKASATPWTEAPQGTTTGATDGY